MTASLPPAWSLFLGALVIPLLPSRLRSSGVVLVAFVGLAEQIARFGLEHGDYLRFGLAGETLVLMRLDGLSMAFGLIFHIALCIGAIYAMKFDDPVQQVSGLLYAGAAIGAVFAGDLITLFIYWEGTAIASVFLIWARRTERSFRTGMRYLIIQVGSGVLLLSGTLMHLHGTGSTRFDAIGLESPGGWLILSAFGIKCAFPLLHNWLQDAYPEATIAGTVFLSAFTTKLAVYALARSFAGTEILIPIGLTMTLFPIVFAVIENDLRRVLAYSLNNQLGFMVVGIGIGTPLALNGTVAHAFCHILYKALLFMSIGAVLYRTGTAKASELGGLHKSMPWTTGCCIVGAASISAFPLFSGFVSKSLILSAVGEAHLTIVMLGLLFASAGVMEHSGIKIPYFAFFAHDSGRRVQEAPVSMVLAQLIAAAFCILLALPPAVNRLLGLASTPLYTILPYEVSYNAYDATHIVTQLQLLLFAGLAFGTLIKLGVYPREIRSTNLDFDWTYRRLLPDLWRIGGTLFGALSGALSRGLAEGVQATATRAQRIFGPGGALPHAWPTSVTVLWVALTLAASLLVYFF